MRLYNYSLIILFCVGLNNCQAQKTVTDDHAIIELTNFYKFYIQECSDIEPENHRRIDSLRRQYSTANLKEQLKEEREAGYDFIVQTNGCQIEAKKTVKVTKDKKGKDIFVVSFAHYYYNPVAKEEMVYIKLKIIKTETGILIDKIIM